MTVLFRSSGLRPMFRLQLWVSVVFFSLALLTTCHPRPAATSLVIPADPAQGSRDVGVAAVKHLERDGRAVATSLRPRVLTFHQYLDIGNGWNMYYSSWPSVVLPVRKCVSWSTFLYRLPSSQQEKRGWELALAPNDPI